MRADGPATFISRVLTPLCECLEWGVGECDFLGVAVGRNDRDGELVAVPVVGRAVAVDAKEERAALGEQFAAGVAGRTDVKGASIPQGFC
ncbi:hypothetical protein C444_08105 [Haloarcula japonica DSM 6131]|uniref:Uncharacterized protein n=2 Tax=Haloarcula TaxID=2237 RepID=A0A830EVI4_9EURY|nr:hypothetical protein C444_08105 [Haloarcula japonica DSM 6131]GGK78627.1 hypothetical protein GCM10009067_33720 [Haloarcula sebkhae]